ncbi:hypothetical protein NDU88_003107 [Pleurodeles waltl]|uniref:Uncharacterized protein n=1 Tax=Pleurodeles waltl TaxID=8319 RepID=A0AAV7W4D5_PLEWA|nr:hypothetical protein NDU88_003107 [Pleurodeles waltl]
MLLLKCGQSVHQAVFRAVLRAGGGACFKLRRSRVWDKTSGRSTGVQWVPTRGKGAARAGALRHGTGLSRAVCGRSRPALRAPGSLPQASGQSRRTRRGRGTDLLPPW